MSCEIVFYCSSSCQRADRKLHQKKCGENDIAGGLLMRTIKQKSMQRYFCLHCHALFFADESFEETNEMLSQGCDRCKINSSFLKKLSILEYHSLRDEMDNGHMYSTTKEKDGTIKHYHLKGLGSTDLFD